MSYGPTRRYRIGGLFVNYRGGSVLTLRPTTTRSNTHAAAR